MEFHRMWLGKYIESNERWMYLPCIDKQINLVLYVPKLQQEDGMVSLLAYIEM